MLTVDNLTVAYRQRGRVVSAVEGVSFGLEAGEVLGILGESGCGKTTLLRALVRLVSPQQGAVRLCGIDWLSLAPKQLRSQRRRMQLVFQDGGLSLNPRLSVEAAVSEPLVVQGIGDRALRRDRVLELLEAFGLPGRVAARRTGELSGGQRQRVAMARAVVLDPDVLLCDEPVSGLDASLQGQVVGQVRDWQRREGAAVIFVSHDPAVLEQIADRVLVMRAGRIVEEDAAEVVFKSPRHPYTQMLCQAAGAVAAASWGRA